MEFVIAFVVVLHQSVEQIVVEVPGSGSFQSGGELLFCRLLGRGEDKGVDLGREKIGLSRITVNQRFLIAASEPGYTNAVSK